MRIRFTKSNYFTYSDGSVVNIDLEKDQITYFKTDPEDRLFRDILFHEESYKEAQKML